MRNYTFHPTIKVAGVMEAAQIGATSIEALVSNPKVIMQSYGSTLSIMHSGSVACQEF